MKFKNLIYAPNTKLILRDLSQINFFDEDFLKNSQFIFTSRKHLPNNLEKKSIIIDSNNKYRYFFWELSSHIRRILHDKKNLNKNYISQSFGINKNKLLFIRVIFFLKIEKFILFFLDKFLDLTIPNFFKKLFPKEKIIFFGSAKDLIFDDLMYYSKKFKTNTNIICTNWDNATTKPYKIKPDTAYCWGKETSYLSEKIHKINSNPIGSIRFERHLINKQKYKHLTTDKIKNKLNLSTKLNYILFAGVTYPFDELRSLKILSEVIKNKKLNVKILYKPHPYGRIKIPKERIDLLENIDIIQGASVNDFDNYFLLLNSIEGIISPYSTLVLEGIFFNKPALCLAYNNNNKNVFNWEMNSKYQPHLQILREFKFPYWCYDINKLQKQFLEFYSNLEEDKKNTEIFEKIISKSIFFNNSKYIDRLKKILI